ncbi:MAG: CBS domain-containing protein [bacterium]|nr:CBS domain-containing protein [bacterium]
MKVKEIMKDVTKLPSNTVIADAAGIMDQKVIGSVLVEEKGKVTGMVTERDILRKVVAKRLNADRVTIKDIMNAPLITVDSETDILDASNILAAKKIRRLVLTENNKIVGIITANDIAKNLKFVIAKKVVDISSTGSHFRPNY